MEESVIASSDGKILLNLKIDGTNTTLRRPQYNPKIPSILKTIDIRMDPYFSYPTVPLSVIKQINIDDIMLYIVEKNEFTWKEKTYGRVIDTYLFVDLREVIDQYPKIYPKHILKPLIQYFFHGAATKPAARK